jgi:hypothetical protein
MVRGPRRVTARRPRRVSATRLNEVLRLDFTQADVDFVIPDLAIDLRLAIDPFLLYKSRDSDYRNAHDLILTVFNEAIHRYAIDDIHAAAQLISFPEVNEIGFGYTEAGIHGSGLGEHLNALLLDTLAASPALVQRGVRHVEEMQLVSLGIGPDRVSDIAANILKEFLIGYTQTQADQWRIPIERGVPLPNVFDFHEMSWVDGHYDLPVNPLATPPRAILLVPRRIVRTLPWINFDDYQRMEFGLFLRAKEIRRRINAPPRPRLPSKPQIVAVTRREVHRIDRYVDAKERDADRAEPEILVPPSSQLCEHTQALIDDLGKLPSGLDTSQDYQDIMFRIFNLLFEPDLIEGRPQVRTAQSTEIRDLIYTNDSDKPFWDFIRNRYANLSVVFELKNKKALENDDIDQLASYLGDPLGYFGLLVSRRTWTTPRRLKAIAWYNKGSPHRAVVSLSDEDVIRMLQMKCTGKDPTTVVRLAYQDFMAKIQ